MPHAPGHELAPAPAGARAGHDVMDGIASISEDAADDVTAELYADIRQTLRVPATNLVWRHLATFDGALAWVWDCVKPLYLDGRLDTDADGLRSPPGLPVLPTWDHAALHAVGLDDADIESVRDVLWNYHATNAPNLLALLAVLRRLEEPGLPRRTANPRPVKASSPMVPRALPSLLDPAALSPGTRDAALRLNELGLPPGKRALVAGVPRHLANWPGFLTLCVDVLEPRADDIGRSITFVHAEARNRAGRIAGELPVLDDSPWRGAIADALRRFTSPELIANYIPKVSMLIRALPD